MKKTFYCRNSQRVNVSSCFILFDVVMASRSPDIAFTRNLKPLTPRCHPTLLKFPLPSRKSFNYLSFLLLFNLTLPVYPPFACLPLPLPISIPTHSFLPSHSQILQLSLVSFSHSTPPSPAYVYLSLPPSFHPFTLSR